MTESKISTQPYKGSRDFYPEDMRLRDYIFNVWKHTCEKFGYEKYDGPFIEPFELYAAKTGDEIVNEQLYSFEDRGGRQVAIRPEMTPTLARMVAQKFYEIPQPIRWYSIPNLWRYENPQRGRLREHYQLNVDVFGVDGVEADLELFLILIEIMKQVGAKENMFEIRINNRKLAENIYTELGIEKKNFSKLNKTLDKRYKLSEDEFEKMLKEEVKLGKGQITNIKNFLKNPNPFMQKFKSPGALAIKKLLKLCEKENISKFVRYDPTIIRGLDYYTRTVFELFDLNPKNIRAMSGGGRYDDLVSIFLNKEISGIGFGMGDVTFTNFLQDWKLIPELKTSCEYLVTLWPSQKDDFYNKAIQISQELRNLGKNTEVWLDKNTKIDKQLKYADKKGIKYVVIVGENELKNNEVTVKNLENRNQDTQTLEKFISGLQ